MPLKINLLQYLKRWAKSNKMNQKIQNILKIHTDQKKEEVDLHLSYLIFTQRKKNKNPLILQKIKNLPRMMFLFNRNLIILLLLVYSVYHYNNISNSKITLLHLKIGSSSFFNKLQTCKKNKKEILLSRPYFVQISQV